MRKIVLPFIILSLISTIIFSVLSANSYSFFIEHQDKLFIEDSVVIKVFDGSIYVNVSDVNDELEENFDSYVIYARENETIYVYNHNYNRMLDLEMVNGEVITQKSGKYTFKQLDLNDETIKEVFIAVENLSEEEVINVFVDPKTGYTDGTVARFLQSYEGMISGGFYFALVVNIVIINLLFVMLYINSFKERIGVMKVLGYNTKQITDAFLKKIIIMYLLSLIIVYFINSNYINFMFSQTHVFSQIISILFIYLFTMIASIFMCGASIYYLVDKLTVTEFLSEVSYD